MRSFTVFSTDKISQEEYQRILRQVGAIFTPPAGGGAYDADITREDRYLSMGLLNEKWFKIYLPHEEMQLDRLIKALRGEPETAIQLDINKELGAINLAIDVTSALAERHDCVVMTDTSEVYTPEMFAGFAEAGYDGYRWNATRTGVVKGPPETAEEKRARLEKARRARALGSSFYGVFWQLFLVEELSEEEYLSLLRDVGAEVLLEAMPTMQLRRGERMISVQQYTVDDDEEGSQKIYQQVEDMLAEQPRTRITIQVKAPTPAVNLALDFLLLVDQRYHGVVVIEWRDIYRLQDLFEFGKPGVDGYRWDEASGRVVKDPS